MQTTSHLLMIRPVHFMYNAQTAVNNSFQSQVHHQNVQEKALKEFDAFVDVLRGNHIDVIVVDDTAEPHTPDSIFPNNWISFHGDTIVLYPMFAENRRAERKQHVLEAVQQKFGKKRIIDLTYFEKQHMYLEGTGSMVLDRENKIAYACLSPRTSQIVLAAFCNELNYKACTFNAVNSAGQSIYHTNVMMCVGDKFILICMDCVADKNEQQKIKNLAEAANKEIIDISCQQMNSFAGNMLQVNNMVNDSCVIMSQQAFQSLNEVQLNALQKHNKLLTSDIFTIEMNGGGSARCMLAEVFL